MNKLIQRIYCSIVPRQIQMLVSRYATFLIYSIIGGLAVLIDIGIFAVLSGIYDVPALIGNVISTMTAMIYSFLANSFINFKVRDKLLKRFISFAFVALSGLIVSSVMLWIFTDILGVNALIIKALSLPIVLVLQFSLNKKFTFQPHTNKESLQGGDA